MLILRNSTFSNSILDDTDLKKCGFVGADFRGSRLIGVNLDDVDIKETDFFNSIIINNNIGDYNSLSVNENTNFKDAIIDDLEFINYVNQFTKNIPEKISNKKTLELKLKEKGIPQNEIQKLLALSKLPN